MKNNKGFSLVELIIVIAIMAILVGVMAPQLIKYIEKTNVSSDTQLCDSVKTAITTAMMDPAVINTAGTTLPKTDSWLEASAIDEGDGGFGAAVAEILGYDDMGDINNEIKSAHGSGTLQYNVVGSNSVHVRITNTDASGNKDTSGAADPIYVD